MRRSHSVLIASLSALFFVMSSQAAWELISYFSRIRSSEKIRSRLRAQSATNAHPTSEASGTRTPRSVTASSGLAARVGDGGGASSFSTLKPGMQGVLVFMLVIIAVGWAVVIGREAVRGDLGG